MRTFSCTLVANDGAPKAFELATTLDVSAHIVEVGSLVTTCDEQLTKISPGDLTLKLEDHDGSIWTWIRTQTACSAGLYPPFVAVDLDGVRIWLGIADTARIRYDERTRVLDLPTRNWSAMLADKYLGADDPADDTDPLKNPWARPWPKVTLPRGAAGPYEGKSYAGPRKPDTQEIGVYDAPTNEDVIKFDDPANWLVVGDILDGVLGDGTVIEGIKVKFLYHSVIGQYIDLTKPPGERLVDITVAVAVVDRDVFPNSTRETTVPAIRHRGYFTRRATLLDERGYYLVAEAVEGGNILKLDVIDGLHIGDRLHLYNATQDATIEVIQVDAQRSTVISRDELPKLAVGDRLFFTDDCLAELVGEDARAVLKRACSPYGCNLDRYTPQTLRNPVLAWFPLRPLGNEDLTSVRDMDTDLTHLRVYGQGSLCWEGSPEAGWAKAASSTPLAVWADQLVAAPSSLMPLEIPGPETRQPKRNLAHSLTYREYPTEGDLNPWDTATATEPTALVLHDYLSMRALAVETVTHRITAYAWTGTAWGSPTVIFAPGSALPVGTILDVCPCIGAPGELITLQAGTIGRVAANGTVHTTPTPEGAEACAVLKTTPWGIYLVGERGYARIKPGALGTVQVSPWARISDVSTFIPTTWCAADADSLFSIAVFEAQDRTEKIVTETWALGLDPDPSVSGHPVQWQERVLAGRPVTAGALRDVSLPGRVLGHVGGRLFGVSKTLTTALALDRFTPSGMTAAELLEHLGQALNAVIVPDATGTMHVITRGDATEAVHPLQVDRVETSETRTWEHFYSVVRVSASDVDTYADAHGQKGGRVLEVSSHPLLWTASACRAAAETLAAWFGVPRAAQTQVWFHSDPSTAAPWEALPPLARVQINGDTSRTWLVLGLDDSRHEGRVSATLVEV